MPHKRPIVPLIAALLGAAVLLCGPARAQDKFPSRPVTLICPWPAGGGADAQMRVLAEAASKYLGQKVVIENRPGAVGTVGVASLVSAKPDGYLLSQATNAVYRQPFITKTAFDPEKDFTHVIGISGYQFGLVVKADTPWASFQDLVAYAKANPRKVKFGTFGVASPPQVVMDRIAREQGIEWVHIPFKGTAENLQQLLGGHITASADGTGWAAQVDSGSFRLLATFGEKRLARWPNVPTLKDLGYAIAERSPWGIVGPKGMNLQVVQTLHDAFKKAMQEPEFLRVLDTLAQEPLYMSSEAYQKFATETIPQQKALVEAYGLKKQ